MLASLAARFATLVALSTLAIAQTNHWVVAPSLGAGVDFTRIQSAINASVEGDVIRVRAGVYQPFVLSKALTIVGDSGVFVQQGSKITASWSSYGVRLSNLEFDGLQISGCSGPVLCDRVDVIQAHGSQNNNKALRIVSCADVRMHRSTILAGIFNLFDTQGAVETLSSSVEFVACTIRGGEGSDHGSGGRGGPGILCTNSNLRVARSDIIGGGGEWTCGLCGGFAGPGGDAISAVNSDVVLAGSPTDLIAGGPATAPGPASGRAVYASFGSLRYSGVTLSASSHPSPIVSLNTAITLAVPPDPTLELIGDPSAGAPVTFRLHAEPGLYGRLQQGDRARVDPDGLSVIPKLNNRIRIHHLGMVGLSGAIDYPAVVPTSAAPGWMRVFQGLEIDQPLNDLIERTNSVVVIAN